MKEYKHRFTCTTCGYSVPIKDAVNRPPHPRLEARVERVSFWSHPLEWFIRRPRLLVALWVASAWALMIAAILFLAFMGDPNLWVVLYGG